jgi:hypothetical protein
MTCRRDPSVQVRLQHKARDLRSPGVVAVVLTLLVKVR